MNTEENPQQHVPSFDLMMNLQGNKEEVFSANCLNAMLTQGQLLKPLKIKGFSVSVNSLKRGFKSSTSDPVIAELIETMLDVAFIRAQLKGLCTGDQDADLSNECATFILDQFDMLHDKYL